MRRMFAYDAWRTLCMGLGVLASLLLINAPLLQSETTPGGDGHRIYQKVQFANSVEESVPLWNPYRGFGKPLISDPDYYAWISYFVDMNGEDRNGSFNLLLLTVAITFSVATGVLFRQMSMSWGSAGIAMLILASSYVVRLTVETGRINMLLLMTASALASLLYLGYLARGRLWRLFGAAFFAGMTVTGFGYYALIYHAPVIYALGVGALSKTLGWRRAMTTALGQNVVLHLVGLGLWAWALAPMVAYNTRVWEGAFPHSILPESLPHPGTLANLFLPFDLGPHVASFEFVSLLALPLLASAPLRRVFFRDGITTALTITALVTVLFCLGRLSPISLLVDLFEELPVINQIRWALPFQYVITVAVAILAGFAFDRLDGERTDDRWRSFRPLLWLVTLAALSYALGEWYAWRQYDPLHEQGYLVLAMESGWTLAVVALLLIPLTSLSRGGRLALLGGLFLMQTALYTTPLGGWPGAGIPAVTENKPFLPRIARFLNNKTDDYKVFVFGKSRFWSNHFDGVPEVPLVNVFSLYYAPELRLYHEALLGPRIPTEKRPYWVVPNDDGQQFVGWNIHALRMAGVKYILTQGGNPNLRWRSQFRGVMREESVHETEPYTLWEVRSLPPLIRAYDRWEIVEDERSLVERMRDPEFNPTATLYLDRAPEIDSAGEGAIEIRVFHRTLTADSMTIDYALDRPAVVFVPELWDPYWEAGIDGDPTRLLKAYGSFRAVASPAGRHTLTMTYTPTPLYRGFWLTLAILALTLPFLGRRRLVTRCEEVP